MKRHELPLESLSTNVPIHCFAIQKNVDRDENLDSYKPIQNWGDYIPGLHARCVG